MEAKQFDELKKILGDLPKKLGDVLAKSSAAVRGPAGEGMAARGAGGGVRTGPTNQPVPGDLIPNPFLEGASKFGPAGPVRDIATILGSLTAKTVPEPAPVLQQGPIGLMGLESGQGKPKLPAPMQPLPSQPFPLLTGPAGPMRLQPEEGIPRNLGLQPLPSETIPKELKLKDLEEDDTRRVPAPRKWPTESPGAGSGAVEEPEREIGLMPLEPSRIPRPESMKASAGGPRSLLGTERLEPRLMPEGKGSPLGAPFSRMPMAGGGPEGLQGGAGTETLAQALTKLDDSVNKLNGHMERAERDQGKSQPQAPAPPIGMTAVPTTAPPSPSAQQRTRRGATSAAETTATILSAIARARGS